MSKEFEAFDYIVQNIEAVDDVVYMNCIEHLNTIKQALQRLEAIDNADSSEALMKLDIIEFELWDNDLHYQKYEKELDTIKNYILKAQDLEREKTSLKLRIQCLEEDLEEQSELAKHYLNEQEKETSLSRND